ncbi:ABC transporter ATP-binding protein [Pseudoclavibacter endophyticus]|uniref:ABC-type quaternary amine transporter n=1 Tax=Pseudoclavibacter endophyticus TaxID=1778590 RepID=A0A6H9WLQ9_9MICO|nr:ABC transporter ATP-binding protein [Pseudoclavibacter endophyticus]KAB1646852.1 ABC transporter ATP-binding protein [Pseudoclavibacter endophyticus]GGA75018.1 ABC transporter ATP-binding protein [Pseudoclavibacter endophyticus]
MHVELTNIEKTFGATRVLKGIDLAIKDGEFVTFLGPSGCGKTTTLRCIAGLEDPDGGSIVAGDRVFADAGQHKYLSPNKRKVGMVFQSYALWPHMTVEANIAYPMKRRRASRAEITKRVAEILEAVGMAQHAKRYPHELSGGQQQRIALARGLVSSQGLMLYDEPLSNLDAKLRIAMRAEIQRLHREFGVTSVYVTHDQEEALALSDRVVIMNGGQIDQQGTPEEIYSRPASRFAADFMGFENILSPAGGRARELSGGLKVLDDSLPLSGEGKTIAFRGKHVQAGTGEGEPAVALAGRGMIRDSVYVGEVRTATIVTPGEGAVRVAFPADSNRFGADGAETDFHVRATDVVALDV